MSILSAKITSAPPLSSVSPVDIPGLILELPQSYGTTTSALVFLNIPMPYAEGLDFPGINFFITVDGNSIANGGFTYEQQQPQSYGRIPFTLVAEIKLDSTKKSIVQAQWSTVRVCTGHIDS